MPFRPQRIIMGGEESRDTPHIASSCPGTSCAVKGRPMGDKFTIYDLLATLVPGTLTVGLVALAAPSVTVHFKSLALPDAFAVVVLTAVAIFAGNIVQAIGSLIDPVLYFTWTGTWRKFPSEVCLE